MPTTDASIKKRPVIRFKGVLILLGLIFTGLLYVEFLFDFHLKHTLEKTGTELHGADVNIGSLKTNFFQRTLEIKNLQVEHRDIPTRNLFEIDKILIHFSTEPLLRRKIVMDDASVEGIRYFTNRNEMIRNLGNDDDISQGVGLLDRVSSSLYGSIKEELGKNPIKFLTQFANGMGTQSLIDGMENELQSTKAVKTLASRLEVLESKLEKKEGELPGEVYLSSLEKRVGNLAHGHERDALQSELAEKRVNVKNFAKAVRLELDAISEGAAEIDSLVEKDCNLIKHRLPLPQSDFSDLTPTLFGPNALNYLERISYWLDLARRRMPMRAGPTPDSFVIEKRNRGSNIHYPWLAGNPSFLIRHLTFKSKHLDNSDLGDVTGTVDGFTTEPAIYGHPVEIHMELAFPKEAVKGAVLDAVIDHTGTSPREEFNFKIADFPANQLPITTQGDLSLFLAKGKGNLNLSGLFEENQLDVHWAASFNEVEYGVKSNIKRVEEFLKDLLAGFYTFDLNGRIHGPFQDLKFAITSELGKYIAEGMRKEFKAQLAAVDDTVRSNILDIVNPKRQAILDRVREIREKNLFSYDDILKNLQHYTSAADKIASHSH